MNQKDIETLAIALPEDILKAKWCGDFDRAFHLIDLYLANEKVPAFMKTRLALEREVLKALPTGYTYSEEDALAFVQKEIPDFTKAELDALRDRGAIDWIYINGKTTYSRTFYDTLLGVYPDIATRAGKPPKDKSDRVEFLRQNVRDMKKDGDALWSIQLRALRPPTPFISLQMKMHPRARSRSAANSRKTKPSGSNTNIFPM